MPAAFVGSSLSLSAQKDAFELIRKEIEVFYSSVAYLEILMKIVDHIDETNVIGNLRSMKVIGSLMSYLRIKLLSRHLHTVEMTAVLLDVLVKNCQYRVHMQVSKKMFMKTYCLVTRQLLADERGSHRCIGTRMLDILQGWGEAMSTTRRWVIHVFLILVFDSIKYCKINL